MNSKALTKLKVQRAVASTLVLEQERRIMALGEMRHWDFRVLGVAPVPPTSPCWAQPCS